MRFKTFLSIHAALACISGVAMILVPASLLASFGVSLVPMGLVIYQFWGTALFGLGLLSWFLRDIEDKALQKSIALSFFIMHGINTIMAIRGQFAGANASGWSNVVFFLLLSLGYAFFLLRKS